MAEVEHTRDVRIAEVSGRWLWSLQAYDHGDTSQRVEVGRRALPMRVGEVQKAEHSVLCLAPKRWLLISTSGHPPQASQTELVLVELTDSLVCIEVEGESAADLLAKVCGLDFHLDHFLPERCARARLAQLAVVVLRLTVNRFELYVGRSYGLYLMSWLRHAGGQIA